MAKQNRYRIERNYKAKPGWGKPEVGRSRQVESGDTWQDAIKTWLDDMWGSAHQLVSETPSADGRSGSIEIQFEPPGSFLLGVNIKATLID